jgi:CubicO group peptidase (beta-lactamase class C family)
VKTVRWQRSSTDCGGAAPVAWPTAAPAEVGLDGGTLETLAQRIQRGELGNLHALLVARDGRLVFERYFAGDDQLWSSSLGRIEFGPETLHDMRSVTKSVVGALVGIALADGSLKSLDAELASFFPERAQGVEAALAGRTVRHALSMSAGLKWDELTHPYWDPRNDENGLWRSSDPLRFALSRPVVSPPGETFAYNGGLPSVLAAVVERVSGQPLDRFAQERLFCPLGVSGAEWVRHESGAFVAASGLRLRPRDMARFGQLMLDGGRAGGKQLVPADYVRASLTRQLATQVPFADGYGYFWWVTHLPDGRDLPVAIGNGGQRVVVERQSRLVIAITAGEYDSPHQGEGPTQVIGEVLRALLRP